MNKKKYEKNVDKDYPGLRKLIDTLSYYNETIKYKKTYIFPESEKGSIFDYEDSDSDSESDRDSDDYYSKDELKQFLYFKNGLDSDIGRDINFDSDSDRDRSFISKNDIKLLYSSKGRRENKIQFFLN